MNQIDIPTVYRVWSAMLQRYQRYTPKLPNIAELKYSFFDDVE